jgi:CheY-like chemotaxis protein
MTQPSTPRPSPARKAQSLDFAPVVLIADDDRVIRELCRESLADEPVRVLTAASGQEALALAEAWIPDLVVTDVSMPHLDGFGLVRALRRLYPGVPVVFMTGDEYHGDRPVEEVAAEHGAVATFLKPFDLSLLQDVVRRAVPLVGPPLGASLDGGRAA